MHVYVYNTHAYAGVFLYALYNIDARVFVYALYNIDATHCTSEVLVCLCGFPGLALQAHWCPLRGLHSCLLVGASTASRTNERGFDPNRFRFLTHYLLIPVHLG